MKTLLSVDLVLAALLATSSLAGCAHTATGVHPINVAAVRASIKSSIAAEPGAAASRTIYSMGAVSSERATIYTEAADGRREEAWVQSGSGWTLEDSKVVAKR